MHGLDMSSIKEFLEEQNEIIKIINDLLETTWTDCEVERGKQIDMPPAWRPFIKHLIKKYRSNGWGVSRNVELSSKHPGIPREYLSFLNPLWASCPAELRQVIAVSK